MRHFCAKGDTKLDPNYYNVIYHTINPYSYICQPLVTYKPYLLQIKFILILPVALIDKINSPRKTARPLS